MDHEDEVLAQGGLIKLFVGQIPKTWEEEEVREILEPYGSIRELTILKDKMSGTHKGRERAREDIEYLEGRVVAISLPFSLT